MRFKTIIHHFLIWWKTLKFLIKTLHIMVIVNWKFNFKTFTLFHISLRLQNVSSHRTQKSPFEIRMMCGRTWKFLYTIVLMDLKYNLKNFYHLNFFDILLILRDVCSQIIPKSPFKITRFLVNEVKYTKSLKMKCLKIVFCI